VEDLGSVRSVTVDVRQRLTWWAPTRPNTKASRDGTIMKHVTSPTMPSTIAATAIPDRWRGACPMSNAPGIGGIGGIGG
jgi:hypothetical protein